MAKDSIIIVLFWYYFYVFIFQEAREKIDRGYRMPAPSSAPSDMYEIMKRCWQDNENDRPTFQQIVELLSQIH